MPKTVKKKICVSTKAHESGYSFDDHGGYESTVHFRSAKDEVSSVGYLLGEHSSSYAAPQATPAYGGKKEEDVAKEEKKVVGYGGQPFHKSYELLVREQRRHVYDDEQEPVREASTFTGRRAVANGGFPSFSDFSIKF